MTRRALPVASLLLALAVASCGGAADGEASGEAPASGSATAEGSAAAQESALPPGWSIRLDRPGSDPSEFRLSEADGALEIRTGPAGIAWRERDALAAAAYAVSATFTEVGAPAGHREAYGLFIGGRDLEADGQAYTYFLVRGDGRFLVKRRDGASTADVTDGWRPSEAVVPAADGDPTNTLEIRVEPDQVRFLVNGTGVATVPAGEIDVEGAFGLRANHNLHLRIADFSVQR
jgi:hypothetical protein